jgi:hypothetical protein
VDYWIFGLMGDALPRLRRVGAPGLQGWLGDTHYLSIGNATRNEAKNHGKNSVFIGKFDDFRSVVRKQRVAAV